MKLFVLVMLCCVSLIAAESVGGYQFIRDEHGQITQRVHTDPATGETTVHTMVDAAGRPLARIVRSDVHGRTLQYTDQTQQMTYTYASTTGSAELTRMSASDRLGRTWRCTRDASGIITAITGPDAKPVDLRGGQAIWQGLALVVVGVQGATPLVLVADPAATAAGVAP